ncbi:MAG: C4-type zinc ribbon domain-containing protein [Vicinamibacteraceae bacterium]
MHPSLEHLIRLQQLETDAGERKRRLADLPARVTDADAAVAAAKTAREAAAAQSAENTASRRAADKELGGIQSRLTKYRDQLMGVKTNKEYTTMQHEIATAEEGVRTFEDQILTLMMQADELAAALKAADAAVVAEERKATGVRSDVESERGRLETEIADLIASRASIEQKMTPEYVRLFAETAAARRGIALSAIRDGMCQACRVTVRPMQVMEARRGDQIVLCESCKRILYVPPPAPAAAAPSSPGTGAGEGGRT